MYFFFHNPAKAKAKGTTVEAKPKKKGKEGESPFPVILEQWVQSLSVFEHGNPR